MMCKLVLDLQIKMVVNFDLRFWRGNLNELC